MFCGVLNKQRRRGVCSFRRLRGAATYSSTCVVPSAWTGLTALFGMGRGGAPSLWPPESFLTLVWKQLCMGGNGYICFSDSFGRLVLLGCDIAVYTPAIYLRRRLQRPLGKSYLGVSFALRCFQRLSNPDLVTQRCSWRNNWYASGQSDTVLSY